jgi:hypothetical protein
MSDDVQRLNPALHTTQKRKEPVAAPASVAESSPLQALWSEALIAHGADVPTGQPEYSFAQPWRQWRFDWAWPDQRVAVELDGGQYLANGGRHNTDSDREKLNSAAALGWRVLRFSGSALRQHGAECVALLRRALER